LRQRRATIPIGLDDDSRPPRPRSAASGDDAHVAVLAAEFAAEFMAQFMTEFDDEIRVSTR
jgi:hypothetical protein